MATRYLTGDVRERCAELADGSVSLVACSPPFIALRSYLPDDDPDKGKEIGSEPDPATFIDTLLTCTAEWGRILAPWGSIVVELGDTYSGSGGGGGDYLAGGMREGQPGFGGSADRARDGNAAHWRAKQVAKAAWPRPKCLALIPQAYALSLAYGRNVLTGQWSPAGEWLVRNQIVWHRPNPAVGALGDKFRPSTSYITVATRSPKRWFDLTAVRRPANPANKRSSVLVRESIPGRSNQVVGPLGEDGQRIIANAAGAPPLDCWFDDDGHDTWTVTTQPSKLAHYAMWPPKLAERIVLSMCPLEVCTVCGEPRRRIEGKASYVGRGGATPATLHMREGERRASGVNQWDEAAVGDRTAHRVTTTIGWTHCGCAGGRPTTWRIEKRMVQDGIKRKVKRVSVVDDPGVSIDPNQYRPGIVVDPFCGTGTTLAVADFHGRDAVGIDLDARNELLYLRRRAEVAKALGSKKSVKPVRAVVGQLDMFGGLA